MWASGENPYWNPETHGLEIVAEVDDPDVCWSFNLIVVWRRKSDGTLLWGEDAGCSCPSPFEDVEPQPLSATRSAFMRALDDHPAAPVDKQRLRVLAA